MLRVGVVGVGSMGQNHARIYSEMGNLVCVYDAFADAADKVASRLRTTACGSVAELLSKVDAVSICTPTSTHYDVAVQAIKAGKAVLLEKPFTGVVETATTVCEAAEDEGVTLASGFVERFNPVVSATKDSLSAGRFGELVSISSRRVSSFPSRIRDVGVIKDLAIHDVDVIRYITSSEVRSVYALGGRMNNPQFEDHASFLMEVGDRVVGTVEANWLTPMKVRKVSLTCSKGFVEMDYVDQSLEFSTASFQDVDLANLSNIPMELDSRHIFVKKEEPLKRELQSFVRAASSNAKAEVDGWDAVANLKVCDAALQSLKEGKRVEIQA